MNTQEDIAYIAGFLDGDGSIMAQVKHRRDTSTGLRIMLTICLYQDTRHAAPLRWMREVFGIGYISKRNDGITEYRINGFEAVERILYALQPFIRFKRKQVRGTLRLIGILKRKRFSALSKQEKRRIADLICDIRDENYTSSLRTYTRKEMRFLLTNS